MKLIILDRDGVINEDSDHYIKSPEEWIPIAGSLEAIAKLNAANYKVAIATNQSGIARGYYDHEVLAKMHEKMHDLLAYHNGKIDYISYCPHGPDDYCTCRKPKAGMLLEITDHFATSTKNAIFIGDTLGDLKAAQSAKIPFILVKTGKGGRTLKNEEIDWNEIPIFESLSDYVDQLLETKS